MDAFSDELTEDKMIQEVEFDQRPMHPGERRILRAWATAELSVGIMCFTSDPPPPGYKACAACGTIKAGNGETIYVEADQQTFQRPGGHVEVIVRDASGDSRTYRLTVQVRTGGAGRSMQMGA